MYRTGFDRAQAAWDNMEPPSAEEFIQYMECGAESGVDGEICEFSGKVTVGVLRGLEMWDCPICENEHEEYI